MAPVLFIFLMDAFSEILEETWEENGLNIYITSERV